MPKYSVCMTCWNEVRTVKDSLNSLLQSLDDDYEVIVVDNFSRDGTHEVLKEFERSKRVSVIQKRCSRGLGRQVAFENSMGEYIIANLDLDDIFLPVVRQAAARYHEIAEGNLMALFNFPTGLSEDWVQNMTVGPRDLISSLGGWRDLNVFEDWDLWSRANVVHHYGWSSFRFAANETLHPETKGAYSRLVSRYERYKARLQLGRGVFSPHERIGLSQRLAYLRARLFVLRKGVFEGQDLNFDPLDENLYVNLFSDPGGDIAAPATRR